MICKAKYVSATGYRSQSLYEFALETRMNAQIKRKQNQIEDIQARMDPNRAPLEVQAIEVARAQVLDFGALTARPAPGELTPDATQKPVLSYAERVFGAQVEAEERARAAAVNATPEPVLSYAERLLQHQERQALETASRTPEPVIETREARLLRQVEEEDERKALALLSPAPESDPSEEVTSRKAV